MKKVNCATCNLEHTIDGIGAIFSVDWTCSNGHRNRTDGVVTAGNGLFMPYQRVKTKALPPEPTPEPTDDELHEGAMEGCVDTYGSDDADR